MGDVVNLNQYRKQRVRSDRRKSAAANRYALGRDTASRSAEDRDRARRDHDLAGKRLDDAAEDDEPSTPG